MAAESLERVDCVIAGGGVVGLAIARALALQGRQVLVLERNADFGLETSSRNSEVIHAGIYYPPGSLKGRFCREGRDRLVAYLQEKALPHRLCGKLIVAAVPEQQAKLDEIEGRARANGVTSLMRLRRDEILALEPELACESGLFSPATGILDSRAYMSALATDIEAHGGLLVFRTIVLSVRPSGSGFKIETSDESGERFALHCESFVNTAGLWASDLAGRIEIAGSWRPPETRYARGTYYGASGATPFSHLVYPVPERGGLGVHLTLDLQGAMRFGPDVEWIDGVDYSLTDRRREHFRAAISRYWPAVRDRELNPISCGIRPKLTRAGEPDADFLIAGPQMHGMKGLVQLFGIESPGLTSSLAIAEHVAEMLKV